MRRQRGPVPVRPPWSTPTGWTGWRTLAVLPLTLFGVASGRAQETPSAGSPGMVGIDRWLISAPLPADRRNEDGTALGGAREEGVLPDRGREDAGIEWTLVRRDGDPRVPLDSVLPDRPVPAIVYAHAYVRAPRDITARLAWRGEGATGLRAWLNGRPLLDPTGAPVRSVGDREASVRVRLGQGWNTVLLQALEGEGSYGFSARIGAEEEGGGATPLRIQASRPPGEVRTGPEPWMLVDPGVSFTGRLAWRDGELLGGIALGATAWGRTPVDEVRLTLKAGGTEAKGTARWLTPGAPTSIEFWVPFDRLLRASTEARGVEAELRWGESRDRQVLVPPRDVPASPAGSVRLAGWNVRSAPDGGAPDGIGPDGPLPAAAGWMLAGEWKVPDELAGRSLRLDRQGAPGDYRLGDRALGPDAETAFLCAPCRKGEKIAILVRTGSAWDRLPVAVPADTDPDSPASRDAREAGS